MTQKLTFAALVFSAATTAGATCTQNQIAVGECGDVPDPRQTTAQPITVDTRVTPVIAVSPTLSSTGTNTLDATVQGTNTLNGAVNGTVNGTNTNAFTPTNTNTGTNTGYVSGTNTNNNNFDPNNTNHNANANANHNAANSGVTVGQGALSPTAIGMGGSGGAGGAGGAGGSGGNASSGANAVGVGGNAYSGATGGTGIGGVGMGGAGGESRSTATGVGGNQSQNQGQALDNRNTISATTGDSTSKAITGPAIASTGAVTTGGAAANAAPQTQTFAPVSNYTYKEAKNPVNTAIAPTIIATPGQGCMVSKGGVSLGVQVMSLGASVSHNGGTDWTEGSDNCDNRQRDQRMIGSGKAPLECLGVLTAAQRDPALAKALEIAESKGQLSASFCQALANPPVTVTVLDSQQVSAATPNKNPCANGATPVWNAGKSDFECRNNVYRMK